MPLLRPLDPAAGVREVLTALRYGLFRALWPPTKALLTARQWLSTGYDEITWLEQQMVYPVWAVVSGMGISLLWVCRVVLPADSAAN